MKTHSPGQTSRAILKLDNLCSKELGGVFRPTSISLTAGEGQFDCSDIVFDYEGTKKPLKEPFFFELPGFAP